MPKRSVRARRRNMGFLSVLIGLTALAAVALVCAIVVRERLQPAEVDVVAPEGGEGFVDVSDLPDTEIVLKASTFSEKYLPTPTPAADWTPEPTESPTPRPTLDASDPYSARRPVAMGDDLLPVFKKAFTEEKVIAITLNECSGATITQNFVDMAQKYGARLTLFPTGENILKAGMGDLLKKCVFELGYEIENRGYTAYARLYRCPANLMVQEVWKQSIALSFVLGVKYDQHFYRMYGGLGESDPRTHAFLKEQGYLGIAHWTVSGSDTSIGRIPGKLTPGGIYSFKSTEDDGKRMQALMEAAQKQGYRMVTMNELFGYSPNSYHSVQGSLLSETMPTFAYDDDALFDLYPGDASWAVYKLQERLIQLQYLPEGEADGIFGEGTSDALRMFQAQVGQAASGAGNVATLELLYAADAPVNPNPVTDEPEAVNPNQLLIEEGELLPSVNFDEPAPETDDAGAEGEETAANGGEEG